MVRFRIMLFGGFELRDQAGEIIQLPGTQTAFLLAILALNSGKPVSRQKLISYLWEDRDEDQGRSSLRQVLWNIRKSLEPNSDTVILTSGDNLALSKEAVEVDVGYFEELLAAGSLEDLERASLCYQGKLLDGFAARGSLLDDHINFERERFKTTAVKALTTLVGLQHNNGAIDAAIDSANRIISIDPLSEYAHRALMDLFSEQGKKAQALKQYEKIRGLLRSELDVEPNSETTNLYQNIKLGQQDPIHNPSRPTELAAIRPATKLQSLTLGLIAVLTIIGILAWHNGSIRPAINSSSNEWESQLINEISNATTRGYTRQRVKAGRLNLQLKLSDRWVAQLEDLKLVNFTERNYQLGHQKIVLIDKKNIAHVEIFKWYYPTTSDLSAMHKWVQDEGVRRLVVEFLLGKSYTEIDRSISWGSLGSGEDMTIVSLALRIENETRYVRIAYVIRGKPNAKDEILVFFFHNSNRAQKINNDDLTMITGSASKMFD
jgi:DNA-binding SARP family transcriptional activator